MIFPVWFLELIVIGGLALCSAGAAALIVFLVIDLKENEIW